MGKVFPYTKIITLQCNVGIGSKAASLINDTVTNNPAGESLETAYVEAGDSVVSVLVEVTALWTELSNVSMLSTSVKRSSD